MLLWSVLDLRSSLYFRYSCPQQTNSYCLQTGVCAPLTDHYGVLQKHSVNLLNNVWSMHCLGLMNCDGRYYYTHLPIIVTRVIWGSLRHTMEPGQWPDDVTKLHTHVPIAFPSQDVAFDKRPALVLDDVRQKLFFFIKLPPASRSKNLHSRFVFLLKGLNIKILKWFLFVFECGSGRKRR